MSIFNWAVGETNESWIHVMHTWIHVYTHSTYLDKVCRLCLPVTGLSLRRTDDGLRISARNL